MSLGFKRLNEGILGFLKFGNDLGWFILHAFSRSTLRVYCRVLDCTAFSQWRSARHYLHYWLGTGGFRSAVTGSPNLCCQMKRPWGGVRNNEQALGGNQLQPEQCNKTGNNKKIP